MFNFKLNFMSYDFKYADLLDDDVFKLVFGRESILPREGYILLYISDSTSGGGWG